MSVGFPVGYRRNTHLGQEVGRAASRERNVTRERLASAVRRVPLVALLGCVSGQLSGQEISASPVERKAIEERAAFFRTESDAIRDTAGIARAPNVEDCVLLATQVGASYLCPAPSTARAKVESALIARDWMPTPKSDSDPRYSLGSFRKGEAVAFFVCTPAQTSCVLELRERH